MVSEWKQMSKCERLIMTKWRQDATRPGHGRLADVFSKRHVAIGVRVEVLARSPFPIFPGVLAAAPQDEARGARIA